MDAWQLIAMVGTAQSGHELEYCLELLRHALWSNLPNLHDMMRLKGYEALGETLQVPHPTSICGPIHHVPNPVLLLLCVANCKRMWS